MINRHLSRLIGSIAVMSVITVAHGQSPSGSATAAGQQPTGSQAAPAGEGREGGRGQRGRGGTPIPGATAPPRMIFHEGWTRAPLSQPITQDNLGNQHLTLHIYGDPSQIRKAMHPLDDYTYTGETTTNAQSNRIRGLTSPDAAINNFPTNNRIPPR